MYRDSYAGWGCADESDVCLAVIGRCLSDCAGRRCPRVCRWIRDRCQRRVYRRVEGACCRARRRVDVSKPIWLVDGCQRNTSDGRAVHLETQAGDSSTCIARLHRNRIAGARLDGNGGGSVASRVINHDERGDHGVAVIPYPEAVSCVVGDDEITVVRLVAVEGRNKVHQRGTLAALGFRIVVSLVREMSHLEACTIEVLRPRPRDQQSLNHFAKYRREVSVGNVRILALRAVVVVFA